MIKLSAEIKGIQELNKALELKPLRSALSTHFNKRIAELQKEIKASVYNHFSILENIDKVSKKYFTKSAGRIIEVSLVYNYKPVRLSSYPTQQVRVTTGKQLLFVSRSKKGAFKKEIVSGPEYAIATYVKVKKAYKLVVGKHGPDKHGRAGFMGWMHTGKLGRARFRSSGIYERLQQATWSRKTRLPVTELYGPSFVQIIGGPDVQKDIENSRAIKELLAFVARVKF